MVSVHFHRVYCGPAGRPRKIKVDLIYRKAPDNTERSINPSGKGDHSRSAMAYYIVREAESGCKKCMEWMEQNIEPFRSDAGKRVKVGQWEKALAALEKC